MKRYKNSGWADDNVRHGWRRTCKVEIFREIKLNEDLTESVLYYPYEIEEKLWHGIVVKRQQWFMRGITDDKVVHVLTDYEFVKQAVEKELARRMLLRNYGAKREDRMTAYGYGSELPDFKFTPPPPLPDDSTHAQTVTAPTGIETD